MVTRSEFSRECLTASFHLQGSGSTFKGFRKLVFKSGNLHFLNTRNMERNNNTAVNLKIGRFVNIDSDVIVSSVSKTKQN